MRRRRIVTSICLGAWCLVCVALCAHIGSAVWTLWLRCDTPLNVWIAFGECSIDVEYTEWYCPAVDLTYLRLQLGDTDVPDLSWWWREFDHFPPESEQDTGYLHVVVPVWWCGLPFVVVAIPTTIWLWRSRRRIRFGHCPRCGYNLTGNTSGRCPECGQEVSAGAVPATDGREE